MNYNPWHIKSWIYRGFYAAYRKAQVPNKHLLNFRRIEMSGAHDSLLRDLRIAPITDKMEGMKITITNDKSDENPWETGSFKESNWIWVCAFRNKGKQTRNNRLPSSFLVTNERSSLVAGKDSFFLSKYSIFQAPPVDLPSIQGVTFVRTCDNNNTESIRRDLSGVNPGIKLILADSLTFWH